MANSRTWYSWVDFALSDCSTATLQAKSTLWALAAALLGNATGPTLGPAGSIPGGSRWTHYASSDSSTAGIDATNRWLASFNSTKIVRAASGAHSWIVLRDPTSTWYLTIDYLSAADSTALFFLAKAAPTGGTTSLRPTSTDETTMAAAFTFVDSSAWTNGRCHFTTDVNGNFWFFASKNAGATIPTAIGMQTLTNLRQGGDTWPTVLVVDAFQVITGAALREASNLFYRGGTGGTIFTKAYNPTGPTVSASVATVGSLNTTSTQSLVQVQNGPFFADSLYEGLPVMVCTTTAAIQGFKGELPDCRTVSPTATGTRYPSTGDVDRILVGSTLVPLTAIPTL